MHILLLAIVREQGHMTISERGRLNLVNKAYDILFNRGDKIFYGTNQQRRCPNIRWSRATGKIISRDDVGIVSRNWPVLSWPYF